MSKKTLFSIKIDAVRYFNKSGKLSMTNEFEEADIIKAVNRNLAEEGFKPDMDSLVYASKDSGLYIEGSAHASKHEVPHIGKSVCSSISTAV